MTTAPPIGPATTGPTGADTDPEAGRTSHRLRYAVVGLVLAASLAFLLVKGLSSALDFYLPANQAVAQRATLAGQTFNLEGLVQPNSIRSTPGGVDFVITAGSTSVPVQNTGSPPQLFQAGIPVIAVGHFSGSGTSPSFISDQILVKHSSTYIAAHPGRVTAPNGSKR
jgi:cytochrome c-type biogenesis protein CcmE